MGITEIMISFVTACISLSRLGVLYDVKSPKTRPYDRLSVCDVFSESKCLVSLSRDLVAYTWYLQIFVEEAA